ncbi:hypothetical protein QBC39DRAFT_360993 [Podospora conica]|nr:hypothetical protein QBC39DRAFT_360993 [Schizothecium conicum]
MLLLRLVLPWPVRVVMLLLLRLLLLVLLLLLLLLLLLRYPSGSQLLADAAASRLVLARLRGEGRRESVVTVCLLVDDFIELGVDEAAFPDLGRLAWVRERVPLSRDQVEDDAMVPGVVVFEVDGGGGELGGRHCDSTGGRALGW